MKLIFILTIVLIIGFPIVELGCQPSYHFCGETDLFQCIPKDWLCDHNTDCADGSDEALCNKVICTKDQFHCLNSDSCISISKICNGVKDCVDNSDELNCTMTLKHCDKTQYDCMNSKVTECIRLDTVCNKKINCSTNRNVMEDCAKNMCTLVDPVHRCSHTCINKYSSYVCDCPPGMKLDEDEFTCKITDICLDNPQICEQLCTVTTESYICSCYAGFKKVGSNCILDNLEAKPYLLYLSFDGIYDVSLLNETSMSFERIKMLMPIKDRLMIFDAKISGAVLEIYSSHVENERVLSLDVFGTLNSVSKKQNAEISRTRDSKKFSWSTSFFSIAVDPLRNLLFWTDTNISVISVFNTSSLDKIDIITKDCYYPTNIVLNPISSKIFWIDLGNKDVRPRILMSNMDGSDIIILIKSGLRKPTSLAVDVENQKLYWTDLYPGSINFLNLKSPTEENNVVFESYDFLPFSIALYGNRIYWSDWRQNRIYSVHKISGKGLSTVVEQVRPSTIRIVSSLVNSNLNRMINAENSHNNCEGIHNPCDFSCLPTSSKNVTKCFGTFHQEITVKSHSFWWIFIIPMVILLLGILIFKYRNRKYRKETNIIVSATNGCVYDHVKFWDDDKNESINYSQVVSIDDTVPILETV